MADQCVRSAAFNALLLAQVYLRCWLGEGAFAEGPDDENDTAQEEEQASEDWFHVSRLRQDMPEVSVQSSEQEVDEDHSEQDESGAFVSLQGLGGERGAFFEQPGIYAGEP